MVLILPGVCGKSARTGISLFPGSVDLPQSPAKTVGSSLSPAFQWRGTEWKRKQSARGQIVNKSVLLREVETDTAALVQLATDMDDLALQFDGTDAGKRFIEAWKRARIIVDTGGGHSGTPPTPPTPPATPGK